MQGGDGRERRYLRGAIDTSMEYLEQTTVESVSWLERRWWATYIGIPYNVDFIGQGQTRDTERD